MSEAVQGITALGQMFGLIVLLEVMLQAFTTTQTVKQPFYIYSSSNLSISPNNSFTIFSASQGGKLESMRVTMTPGDFTLTIVIDGNQVAIPSTAIMSGAVPLPGVSYVASQDSSTFVLALDNIEFNNSLQVSITPTQQVTITSITAKGYTLTTVRRFGLALA